MDWQKAENLNVRSIGQLTFTFSKETMMKAIIATAAGGPEVLQLTETDMPALPGPEFMRVKLHAAGLNPVDFKMRKRCGLGGQPYIPGCDGAGVVESVGSAVTRFRPGDAVYFCNGGIGTAEPGNYAEYTVAHQDVAAHIPSGWSLEQAAGLPLAWITAWESLRDRARLAAGQTVLIHAGAGGVGHLAIQLAASLGARVAVTVSGAEKTEFCRRLGAELCIEYRQQDFVQATLDWTQGRGADVVFDTVGGDTFCRSFGAACVYGQVVTLLEPVCDAEAIKIAKLRNLSLSYELMLTPMILAMPQARAAQGQMLRQATELANAGKLEIQISRTFPLAQAAQAHRLLEQGHIQGKLVLC
jgi:NADPH2:quinone reductase